MMLWDFLLSSAQAHSGPVPHFHLMSSAQAQAGANAAGSDFLGSFLVPLLLVFAVFYFLLIRPQNKKLREHRRMVEALRRGDKVITGGGIIGSVAKVDNDTEITLEIAPGVKVKILRQSVTDVLGKNQPADGNKKKEAGGGASKNR